MLLSPSAESWPSQATLKHLEPQTKRVIALKNGVMDLFLKGHGDSRQDPGPAGQMPDVQASSRLPGKVS